MRHNQIRLWVLRLTLGVALASIVLTILFVKAKIEQSRVQSAIASFERDPSQRGADRLVALLEKWRADADQAERILIRLLWPKVTTRPQYSVGEPASVIVEQPFSLSFRSAYVTLRQLVQQREGSLNVDGRGRRVITTLPTTPETFIVHRSPSKPGTYYAMLQYECVLQRPLIWDHVPRWLRFGFGKTHEIYRCRFDVPIEIAAVEKKEQ